MGLKNLGIFCGLIIPPPAVCFQMLNALQRTGFTALLNEPWSGMTALADSSTVHARAKTVSEGSPNPARSLLLEVRQDLVLDDAWRGRLVEVIKGVLLDPSEGLVVGLK